MFPARLKTILRAFSIVVTLAIIMSSGLFLWLHNNYSKEMQEKLLAKKFLNPTEFYAAPFSFRVSQVLDHKQVHEQMIRSGFRERERDQPLAPKDYSKRDIQGCLSAIGGLFQPEETPALHSTGCLHFLSTQSQQSFVFFNEDNVVTFLWRSPETNSLNLPLLQFELSPPLIAQYINNEPVLNEVYELRDIPSQCLDAVISIEDPSFLEHSGVSFRSILRAFWVNLKKGRLSQGGSTLTQQTVKNYLLTSERSIKRKIQEAFMSIMLENEFTKDQILETYFNIIYMGQSGAFQVRGFGSAARYYFGKDLKALALPECALLAAILNCPGCFDPFKHPERALSRRNLVLAKMQEHRVATEAEVQEALKAELPKKKDLLAQETAPYYLDAVRRQLNQFQIPASGAKVYTALNPRHQEWAESLLQQRLVDLETHTPLLSRLSKNGKKLEAALISIDLSNGLIDVLVGGRSFHTTQFNRALDTKRQVGSTIKPCVFLAALEGGYHAESTIEDEPIEFKFGRNKWRPENYNKDYHGKVTLSYALQNSLNAATANLGAAIGFKEIVKTLKKLGMTSPVEPYPSLVLGAFEMTPLELLKIYLPISRMGQSIRVGFVRSVELYGSMVFEHGSAEESLIDPQIDEELVSMLRQVVDLGTAKIIRSMGFQLPAAGKTGTTNDYKDAWFVGFTTNRLTLVWLGYDDNTPHHLTGGGAAAPIWASFAEKISASQ